MADLIESLRPFLRGIDELNWQKTLVTLAPNDHLLWKPDKAGWLVDYALVSTNPNITVEHNFWGQKVSYTIANIYALGSTHVNSAVGWVEKWDTTYSIYTFYYCPRPYDYYTEVMYIDLINKEVIPIYVYAESVHYLDLVDVAEFKASLKEVFTK